jgi:hypothetical protein
MAYVEFLRIRKALMWHVGIIAVLAIAIASLGDHSAVHIDSPSGRTTLGSGTAIPLGIIAALAAFFAAIFASSAGISFNRESQTRDLSWTKPISRTALAVQFVAIDLGGVIVSFAAAFVAIRLVMLQMHIVPYLDDAFAAELLLGIGIGTMWYALLQVLTCGFGPGARALSGILWPVALVLAGLHSVPGPIGAIARAADVINPLVYLSTSSSGSGVKFATGGDGGQSDQLAYIAHAPVEFRALLVWFFTLVFISLAIMIWPNKEA